jgi:hypothetical protein
MQTLREAIEELPKRITKVRLFTTRGIWLGNYTTEEAIQKYGARRYSSGYSESFSEISLWIY